jgi:hypothetical protein
LAHGIPTRLTPAEGRKFAFTVGLAFAFLGAIVRWRGGETAASVLWGLASVLLVLGTFVPAQLGPVQRAWMGLALLISKVTTPLFMGVVYFAVISPISLMMRILGKRPLLVRPASSYWMRRDPGQRMSDLTRQF